jgi:hypothetical protein
LEGISVNNLALFVCGLVVTLMSGMGILVYMVHLGYKEKEKEKEIKEKSKKIFEEKINADLGSVPVPVSSMDSFLGIPSVS